MIEMEISGVKEIQFRSVDQGSSEKNSKKPSQTGETETPSREIAPKVADQQKVSLERLTESLNQFMKEIAYNLQFIPDREAGVVVIKVIDGEGKVIRQIPPEAILSLSSNIGETIGVLVNSNL